MDKKILIIEDEAAIQKILSEPLTFAGYKVTTASDGLEGINTFHQQDFDLILKSVMLNIPMMGTERFLKIYLLNLRLEKSMQSSVRLDVGKQPCFPCLEDWIARLTDRCCFKEKILRKEGLRGIVKTM